MTVPKITLDEVPIELRMLAVAAMNANDALPEDDQDQTPDHILAAVLPEHKKQVRAKVAEEILADVAAFFAARVGADMWEAAYRAARIVRGES